MLWSSLQVQWKLDNRCASFEADLLRRIGPAGSTDGTPRAMFALCEALEAALSRLEIQLTEDLRNWPDRLQAKACEAAKDRIRGLEPKATALLQSRASKPEEKELQANYARTIVKRSADRLGIPAKA